MKPELMSLVCATILTAVIWIPYVLDRMAVWGLSDTVGYPENPKPQSPWAKRMKSAHANAVENLVIFATLVLVANAVGISNSATVFAAALTSGRAWCTCLPTPSRCRGFARLRSPEALSRKPSLRGNWLHASVVAV